ncbi:cytochrome c-type biogenesis protein [Amycolatopsis silviterrae]|uniref:Cytochrome c-type biogenesis protein n=1 Tax=Amycolatopsis silviterrae TaxID=1656914 RepID=A0ABW5HHJ5_9PSEU
MTRRWRFLVVTAAIVALGALALLTEPSPSVDETARQLGSALRCPTCQGVSVADSPSPVARDMRDRIVAELRAGRTPDDIRREFVAAYGDWVLLEPPSRGLGLLPWAIPAAALVAGATRWALAARRWIGREGGARGRPE